MIIEMESQTWSCSLNKVLEVYGTPLNEEQAWAICHQCAKCADENWKNKETRNKTRCKTFNGIESVDVCKDGSIRINDFVPPVVVEKQNELVESIGLVIYQALDYGLDEAEEHRLSPALEGLIDYMTECQSSLEIDEGDEGIEHDVEDEQSRKDTRVHVGTVLQMCTARFTSPLQAQPHYRAVCRAIFAEVTELSTFLERVSSESEKLKHDGSGPLHSSDGGLEDLKKADWARLWIQMMQELRQGVKLRKRHNLYEHRLAEYTLTPYEILMEDIRLKRYTLNKVMVNGDIPPNIKQDAHNLMLQFIRSRPPLHPASDRKLNTASEPVTDPREKLLCDIRCEHQLRPTPGRSLDAISPVSDHSDVSISSRKIIKPNLMLHLSDEEEEFIIDFDDKNRVSASSLSPLSPLSPLLMDDAAKQDDVAAKIEYQTTNGNHNHENEMRSKLPSGLPIKIQSPSDCLSLTLEEVMHIRNVLTKAELESLLVNPDLHAQVEKAKICFTCKVTKFSLFGSWSTKCRFCQRYVCSACVSKMAIPREHFESIPVYTLSPSPLSPASDVFLFDMSRSSDECPSKTSEFYHQKHEPKFTREYAASIVGTTDNTLSGPLLKLKELAKQGAAMALTHNEAEETSSDANSPKTSHVYHTHGPTMNVCRDCKSMIVGIINTSHLSLHSSQKQYHS